MSIVALWCLDFDTRRCVLRNAFLRKALERRKDVCARFNGVCRAYDVRIWIADVRVRVRIIESSLIGVDGPCGNVDLGGLVEDKSVVEESYTDEHTCSPRLQA